MRAIKGAKWVLGFYVIIAILHPFIANDKPFLCTIEGKTYYPILSKQPINCENASKKWMPLIPFSYATLDTKNSYVPPLSGKHLLGTDILGRDTFAGILKGTEIAIKIGFSSVLLAAIVGILVGLFVAYFKRFAIRLSMLQLIVLCISIFLISYYTWIAFNKNIGYFFIPFIILCGLNLVLAKYSKNKERSLTLPVDGLYLRIIEAMKALPALILILACLSLFETFTIGGLILLLAFLMWPGISRYVRAEATKVLAQDYITAAKAYGASGFRIVHKHVLPKLVSSLSVLLAFSVSSVIIIESTLSFLGLGIPIEQVSWGTLLKEAQSNINAWWLAVFPGLALFGLIFSLNVIGERFSQ